MEVPLTDEAEVQGGTTSLTTASLFFKGLSPLGKLLAVRLAEMSDEAKTKGKSLIGTGPYSEKHTFRKQIRGVSTAFAKGDRVDCGDDHLIDFMNGVRTDKPTVKRGKGSGGGSGSGRGIGAGSCSGRGGGSASGKPGEGVVSNGAAADDDSNIDPDDSDFES